MKTLGIYYIATSNYKLGFEHFKKNIHLFFPQFKKTVIVLSDGLDEYDGKEIEGVKYQVHYIKHFCWPIIALFKMKFIYDFRVDCDYICYFNGNLQVNACYDFSSNSNLKFDKLNCPYHANLLTPHFDNHIYNKKNDASSQAYINKPYKYIQSGFFFGPSDIVYKMCKEVNEMCEIDLKNNIIPEWHDESYLNKWCIINEHLVNKAKLMTNGYFMLDCPVGIVKTINKNKFIENKYNILIESNDGRFANQLFSLFQALTLYEKHKDVLNDKIYFNNEHSKNNLKILENDISRLNKNLLDVVSFNKNEYDEVDNDENIICGENFNINSIEKSIKFKGYCQNINFIDERVCQNYLSPSNKIISEIKKIYGDISNYVSLHVRRGDFLINPHIFTYITLSKKWIEKVINKYYPNDKIIVISDDMDWCKKNLSQINNIMFADKTNDVLIDFYIQTLTKANICSASTFSIAGAILNKNNDCVIPKPFFKNNNLSHFNLMLPYAKYETIEY